MDLKVILDVIPEHMEEHTIKHVNQHHSVTIYAIQSGETICDALRPKRTECTP